MTLVSFNRSARGRGGAGAGAVARARRRGGALARGGRGGLRVLAAAGVSCCKGGACPVLWGRGEASGRRR